MSNPFDAVADTISSQARDGGGADFFPPSDVYGAKCTKAYLSKSTYAPNDTTLNLEFELEQGSTIRVYKKILENNSPQIIVNGQSEVLKSLVYINKITEVFSGMKFNELSASITNSNLEIYNFTTGSNEVKSVPVVHSMMGKEGYLCIKRTIENVRKNTGKKKDGREVWADTAERKTTNVVSLAAGTDRLTLAEKNAGITEPAAIDSWVEANKGKDRDKYKEVASATNPKGAPAQQAPTQTAPVEDGFNF